MSKVINPIFSLYLTKNQKSGSKILFGGYDVKKYGKEDSSESDIKWISLDTENMNFWSLPMGKSQIKMG